MLRESMFIVIGAVLAGIIGYLTTRLHDSHRASETRRALASLMHVELVSMSPFDDPIFHDPKSAKRIKMGTLSQILAPGVLDPSRHAFLITNLVFMASTIEEFNERAYLFDWAVATSVTGKELQQLYIQLQMSNRDYQDIHRLVIGELWQVGPPFPFSGIGKPRTLLERFSFWRIRKQRRLWNEFESQEPASD